MKDFKELMVWQKSHELALAIYRLSRTFPRDEVYGLTSQMRRCAVSIPANIAEGSNRGGDREFAHSCRIAMGSAAELEYYLLLASELNLLADPARAPLANQLTEVKKMLSALIKKLTAES